MKSASHNLVAVDLGASNCRVILGRLREGRLALETVHRLEHSPRLEDGRMRWDWPRIIGSIREGLAAAAELVGDEPVLSVSCDSWAQDFGLLDADDRLLFSPVCYRDPRTEGMPDSFAEVIGPDELVRRVGSVASPITTLCQLRAMALHEPELLAPARTLLHLADLVHHDLCGSKVTDRTLATASQLRNLRTSTWDLELLAALGIPHHYLPPVAEAPAVIGRISSAAAPHPKLRELPVVVSASHDTAAPTALLPLTDERVAFISSGTWSMLGCAGDEPIIPAKPARDELGILGLGGGRWGLFRSIMGLWLIQECRRTWAAEGLDLSHDEIADQAERCDPLAQSLIDPDDPRFLAPANMPREVRAYCAETAQPVPNGPGEIARVVFASLALDCRAGVESLEAAAGLSFRALRMVGGGSANAFLCQLTADATRLPVVAGPVEATAIGNILLQARVMGLVGGDEDMAAIAARSFPVTHHEPTAADDEELYQSFTELKRRRTG